MVVDLRAREEFIARDVFILHRQSAIEYTANESHATSGVFDLLLYGSSGSSLDLSRDGALKNTSRVVGNRGWLVLDGVPRWANGQVMVSCQLFHLDEGC